MSNQNSNPELEQLQAQLQVSQRQIARLQTELEQHRQSPVWRVYGIARRLLTVVRLLTQAPANIQKSGGLRAAWFVGARQIRRFGLLGFVRFLAYRLAVPGISPGPGSGRFDRHNYTAWYEKQAPANRHATASLNGPLLSVVIPIYKPDLALFKEAIESVLAQSYPRWELCMADDASQDPALSAYLNELTAQHPNVHVVVREHNGHIAACTNSALGLATGAFVVLFDQDDLLPTYALQRVAETLAQHPDAGILYSDEDRIDASGQEHLTAYFKPDFNYDLFLGQNMVSHLGVYRRALVEQVGGFRADYSGSQDWDLALRVLECIRHDQVVHIPEVLYHWRAVEGSTALNHTAKSYAMTAARQAVASHLERTGQNGRVRPASLHPAYNRVEYALPERPLSASLLLSVPGSASDLQATLAQLTHRPGRVAIDEVQVMAATDDPSAALQALAHGSSDLVVIVTVGLSQVPDQWLDDLARMALQPRAGFVAPRIVDASGKNPTMDHGGVLFTDRLWAVSSLKGIPDYSPGYVGRNILQQRFTALSPAVLVVKRTCLAQAPIKPSHRGLRWVLLDANLQLNAQGLHNVWMPEVECRFDQARFASSSNWLFDPSQTPAERQAWIDVWVEQAADPAYNPNLSSDGDFSLNWLKERRQP